MSIWSVADGSMPHCTRRLHRNAKARWGDHAFGANESHRLQHRRKQRMPPGRRSRSTSTEKTSPGLCWSLRVWTSHGAVGLGSSNTVVDIGDVHASEYGPEGVESVTCIDGAKIQGTA